VRMDLRLGMAGFPGLIWLKVGADNPGQH